MYVINSCYMYTGAYLIHIQCKHVNKYLETGNGNGRSHYPPSMRSTMNDLFVNFVYLFLSTCAVNFIHGVFILKCIQIYFSFLMLAVILILNYSVLNSIRFVNKLFN